MSRCGVFLVLALAACTKANPAAHCQSGTCTDPDFPFCDVNGVVGGEPGACIAVTCTAGAFAECRDNAEVRCNAAGNNYEVVQCERVAMRQLTVVDSAAPMRQPARMAK